MNYKEYLERFFAGKEGRLCGNYYEGFGFEMHYGDVNDKGYRITEVHDDFVVVTNSTFTHIIPLRCLFLKVANNLRRKY